MGETARIILVRHGLTAWNVDSRYQGQTDIPLADEGVAQAQRAAERLSTEKIDRIFASDLARAKMTAQYIADRHGLTVKTDARLREMCFGDWEGLTFSEIGEKWPEMQKSWLANPVDQCPPGGETARELEKRVKEALVDIYHELVSLPGEATGVIVSHGGVIRSLIALASDGEMTSLWSRGVKQGSITWGTLTEKGLAITEWNDTRHLV